MVTRTRGPVRAALIGLLLCCLVVTAGPWPRAVPVWAVVASPSAALAFAAAGGPASMSPAAAGPVPAGPVAAGPASEPGPPGGTGTTRGYRSPLAGELRVTRRFDPPARRWLPGHRGVDLAAPPEAVVVAAGPGVVRFAGPVAGRPVVSIDHPDGLRTTYEPVRPTVAAGDVVRAGDPIGVLAPTHAGCPVAACLHWGVRRGTVYLDPLSLLGLGQVRLLPE